MAGGVKPIFTDPEALEVKINEYFEKNQFCPTLSGLALHLDVTRQTLSNYIGASESGAGKRGKGKAAECGRLLQMAKARIESFLEGELVVRTKSTHGIEFALMNGYGWGQKQTVDVQGSMQTEVKAEVSTPISRMSDEELLEQMRVIGARLAEIMKREGLQHDDG